MVVVTLLVILFLQVIRKDQGINTDQTLRDDYDKMPIHKKWNYQRNVDRYHQIDFIETRWRVH